ncbi:hypothetical protein [Actinomyces faecalis]|uniref:hypothetical protein n=1 Tax=Actinomyces faecalis TaxID=2722820 RepID=UPI0015540863|nr:hypothetical protein [Actinomyces faecalis]
MSAPLMVGVRVDVLRGGVVIASDVPVSDVKAEWSTERTVQGVLTYKAPCQWAPREPLDALNVYGQRSLVTVVLRSPSGREWEVPLGVWLHTSWQVRDGSVEVIAKGLFQVLEEDPLAWPGSPAAGATLRSTLEGLASPLPVVLDEGVEDRAVAAGTQWGRSRTEAIRDLAAAHGAAVRAGADGALHVYPVRGAAGGLICEPASLPGGLRGNGLLLSLSPAQASETRPPNRWRATSGDGADGRLAERTRTDPPFEPDAYGWVTDHREVGEGSVWAAVEPVALAPTALSSRTLTTVLDPRVELGDIVTAYDGDETVTGRVRAVSMPLCDLDGGMRVDIDLLGDER